MTTSSRAMYRLRLPRRRSTDRLELLPRGARALIALASLACLAGTLGACDDDPGSDAATRFAAALPSPATLALDVPGEEAEVTDAPLDVVEAPLLGEPSDLRVLTGAVRHFLGELVDNITDGLDRVRHLRPVVRTAERVVWRERLPQQGFERAIVMRPAEHHFAFTMWVRPLRAGAGGGAPEPWRFLMFGTLTPARGDGEGRGAVWIDLDNDARPRTRGKMSVTWSVIGDTRQIEVTVFEATPDEDAVGRVTRSFRYAAGPDGGLLAFDAGEIDVHLAPDHRGKERVRVLTRWNAARVMRSDYTAVGPEVRGDGYRVLIGSECWRPPVALVEFETRLGLPLAGPPANVLFERGERAACPFGEEEAPVVPQPGAPPDAPAPPTELDTL